MREKVRINHNKYCPLCRYKNHDHVYEICRKCIMLLTRINSDVPYGFEEKEK